MKKHNQENHSKSYPLDFTQEPPTPNHNPLIQATPEDTCHDITAVMEFIGLFLLQSREAYIQDKPYLQLDDKTLWGLTCIINGIIGALQYEIHHRPDPQ